ncbi:unnamed protein product [Protopolystoma xenopodis]|uniref:Uncharacterized protein n=1 Tax=Protopolystoma xenopodis TaxID=117903 RepID=A0A448WTM9_9PLAT|nr:unnamed protein product [Protopolystoma xenopodis]
MSFVVWCPEVGNCLLLAASAFVGLVIWLRQQFHLAAQMAFIVAFGADGATDLPAKRKRTQRLVAVRQPPAIESCPLHHPPTFAAIPRVKSTFLLRPCSWTFHLPRVLAGSATPAGVSSLRLSLAETRSSIGKAI